LISTNGKIAIPEYGKNVKVMNQGFRIFQFDWVKLKIKVELSLLKKNPCRKYATRMNQTHKPFIF
jgi:hypothetical protein